LLHPLTTPSHLLVLVALGLMAGRQGRSELKWPLICFALLCAVALLVTTTGAITSVPPTVLILVALLAGALLALDKPPPPLMVSGLFGAGAVAIGLDSAVEGVPGSGAARTLLGNWLSLSVLVADVALYVAMGRHLAWLQVALRVLGAWVVAIGLLMLAFAWRGEQ
ncbi:MAG TPA: HupE/UreJ family protein, partial [Gemmatimonadales bacterium]|nr:HupE/UreJ family protein [Gemmatimonadales bacterium]